MAKKLKHKAKAILQQIQKRLQNGSHQKEKTSKKQKSSFLNSETFKDMCNFSCLELFSVLETFCSYVSHKTLWNECRHLQEKHKSKKLKEAKGNKKSLKPKMF